MRLICPNCGAQYEVDDGVIPDQGRDVQCSNCGHTWFQPPAHMDTETAEELAEGAPAEAEAPDEGAVPERRSLDPEIASVLREEAARESAARDAEAEGLESQPDLGIDDTAQVAADRSAAARARMARMRGVDEDGSEADAALAGAAAVGSRKELLPDVEEINSTLRASDDRDPEPVSDELEVEGEAAPARKRSGGWASRLILILALLAVLVYLFAPQIVETVPQSEPYMIAYVTWVNDLRAAIDPLFQSAKTWIEGLVGTGAEGEAAGAGAGDGGADAEAPAE